jgi:hypothetical protein
MIGWNGLNEIAEYLDQRELYIGAHIMIRRDRDKVEVPEPTTYLGLAMAAPVAAGHERPCITGASHCCPVDGAYDFSIALQDKGF